MNPQCFEVVHPWAYDMTHVDLKYCFRKDLAGEIYEALHSQGIQSTIFWMTFFKGQKACTSDQFYEAIRQMCEIDNLPKFLDSNMLGFGRQMEINGHVVSLENDADLINEIVDKFVRESVSQNKYCCLINQLKLYEGEFKARDLIDTNVIKKVWTFSNEPKIEFPERYLKDFSLEESSHVHEVNL